MEYIRGKLPLIFIIVQLPVSANWGILRMWRKYKNGRRIIYSLTMVLKASFTEINYLIPPLMYKTWKKTDISNLPITVIFNCSAK